MTLETRDLENTGICKEGGMDKYFIEENLKKVGLKLEDGRIKLLDGRGLEILRQNELLTIEHLKGER